MFDRLRRRGSEEHGVVLVLVAIMMTAFLGMAALAIDLGSFYGAQRKAQAAADAGALGAAQDLAASPAAVTTDGQNFATTNYPGATATVTTPSSNQVKVTVNASAPSFFGHIFGITKANVSATAVAAAKIVPATCSTPGTGCDAIFARDLGDTTCASTAVSFAGGGYHITGGVHSNGSINTGGGGSTFGPTTYGPTPPALTPGCTSTTGGGDTFTSGPTSGPVDNSWPIDYAANQPPCSGSSCTGPSGTPSYCNFASSSDYTFTSSSPPSLGTYCAYGTGDPTNPNSYTGTITFSGGGIGSAASPIQATYVAGTVNTTSGGIFLEAYGYPTNKLLIGAASGGTAVDLGGGGNTFQGDFFAPNGTVIVASGSQSTGFIEANKVAFTSGGITGDGPSDSGLTTSTGSYYLVQ